MGITYNPRIVTDGLVLCLDAANPKGYDSNENLLTYSKDFSSGWNSSLTVTLNNAVAPDGTLTAAKIQRPLNSGNSNIKQNPVLSTNTNYCYSAFIKLASSPDPTNSICSLSSANNLISPVYASISYNFATGVISSFGSLPPNSGVIAYPDGWHRIYMVINTSTQTNASLEIRPRSINTVSDFYIWGAQLERGSSPSPYYATAATAKNRGNILIDLSGNGNNGTLINGVGYNSGNLGSLVFDGSNDYTQTPLSGTFPQISFDFWGFFDDATLSATSRNESAFGDWISNRVHFGTRWSVGMHFNVNGIWQTTPTTNLRYGWNHYVLVYDTVNNLKRVYLNNILSSSHATNGNMVLGDFRIGVATNLNQYYRGNISNFKIYNRALSAAEIQYSFNIIRGRFGV